MFFILLPSQQKMKKTHIFISTLLLIITFFQSTKTTLAQSSSPAVAPAPAGPTNITKILEKAGQFSTFMRLLKSTQVGDQINTQLNNSNQGLTLFAPPDNAFANLKSGTLNSLTDQEKVELIQFHVVPQFLSTSQFQTVSNPLRTQAGNANNGEFPLNVTTGGNQVNITTGVVDTTISNAIYTDGQLAVYQVDKVLLPLDIFGPPSPAAAPKPEKGSAPTAADKSSDSSSATDDTTDSSDAMGLARNGLVSSFIVAAVISALTL